MILALAAGSLITLISSRFRRTSLINLLLTVALVIGLMALSTGLPAGGGVERRGLVPAGRNAIRRGVRSVSSGSPVYRRPVRGNLLSPAVCAAVGRAVRGLFCVLIGRFLQESQHRAHHQPRLLPLPDEGAEGIHPAERAV